MTAQGRREMAYRHYVDHSIRQRQKQIAKANKMRNRKVKQDWQTQPPTPSKPMVSSEAQPTEQGGAPMTFSASGTAEVPNP